MATQEQMAIFGAIVDGSIVEIDSDDISKIGVTAFNNCANLATASFPACTSISASAFNDCASLTTVSFPSCTYIGDYAFQNCQSLTMASFPACTKIGGFAFNGCSNLTTASFPVCTGIGSFTFQSCQRLVALHLDNVPSVPSLGANAFYSTPIGGYSASAGQYGSVYVPASLYEAFCSASNWSTISSRIVSVAEEE